MLHDAWNAVHRAKSQDLSEPEFRAVVARALDLGDAYQAETLATEPDYLRTVICCPGASGDNTGLTGIEWWLGHRTDNSRLSRSDVRAWTRGEIDTQTLRYRVYNPGCTPEMIVAIEVLSHAFLGVGEVIRARAAKYEWCVVTQSTKIVERAKHKWCVVTQSTEIVERCTTRDEARALATARNAALKVERPSGWWWGRVSVVRITEDK
jgi:hypothetical protein